MQTFDQLCQETKLTPEQIGGVKNYINELLLELLESIKQDHIKNFDETSKKLQESA